MADSWYGCRCPYLRVMLLARVAERSCSMVPSRSHHPFWMYEELVRAPDAVAQVLAPDEIERAHRDAIVARLIAARRVFLTGCGTALHAALAGAALLRDLTDGKV